MAVRGDVVAVGAPYDDEGWDVGSVYLYRYNRRLKQWREETKVLTADAGIFSSTRHQSRFGWAVALGREVLFVGAPQESTLGPEAGAAYAFDVAIDETSRWLHRFYYVSDHLGSLRATVNEHGAVVHYDDYNPFGLRMPGRSMDAQAPKERYTGHELDDETGLLYMGARYYDPAIGRVHGVDPLADAYPGTSPYAYVLNNPITLIDPTGACPEDGSEGDAGDGDGYCLAEITVEAERDSDPWLGWGLMDLDSDGDGEPEGKKFVFDASTQGGYQALHDFLMQSNDLACSMVGNEQFSMNARSAAMAACIHSGQQASLIAMLKGGALLMTVASGAAAFGGGAAALSSLSWQGSRGAFLSASTNFGLASSGLSASASLLEGDKVGAVISVAGAGIGFLTGRGAVAMINHTGASHAVFNNAGSFVRYAPAGDDVGAMLGAYGTSRLFFWAAPQAINSVRQ